MELHRDRISKAFVVDGKVVALADDVTTTQRIIKNGKPYTITTSLEVPSLPGEEVFDISPGLADRIKNPKDKLTFKSLLVKDGKVSESKDLEDKLGVPEKAPVTKAPDKPVEL